MIRQIEALNYRCLRYMRQQLGAFHVLVGPNASGKSTFLDVPGFLGDLLNVGLEQAVHQRTPNFHDLVWCQVDRSFELALELEIPESQKKLLEDPPFSYVRYEVKIGLDDPSDELRILAEKVLLKKTAPSNSTQRMLFPMEHASPKSIMSPKISKGSKTVVNKVSGGNDNFYDETGKGWDHAFKLGPRRSALASLPEDESKFPVATWLKRILSDGVQRVVLNSALMRKPSPPGQAKRFSPDGSNLPWVIDDLRKKNQGKYKDWIAHLQTALPDIVDVKTIERPEDRHRYIVICYKGGLNVPSWSASDGTLRLLALTLPAYLVDLVGVLLIEEPENGIHPRAVETMFHSLTSVYGAQVLAATHSPVILGIAELGQVLCFAKTESGAVDAVIGTDHPALRNWKQETDLGTLFAGGVLE